MELKLDYAENLDSFADSRQLRAITRDEPLRRSGHAGRISGKWNSGGRNRQHQRKRTGIEELADPRKRLSE